MLVLNKKSVFQKVEELSIGKYASIATGVMAVMLIGGCVLSLTFFH